MGGGSRGAELAVVARETEMRAAGGSLVASLEDLRLALEGARAGEPGSRARAPPLGRHARSSRDLPPGCAGLSLLASLRG